VNFRAIYHCYKQNPINIVSAIYFGFLYKIDDTNKK
jgi:hypothetical protein